MKLALVPVNVTIGDWRGNLEIHKKHVAAAAKRGAEIVVFPELSLLGYSPGDLMVRPSWPGLAEAQLGEFHAWLQTAHPELAVIVGTTLAVEAPNAPYPRGLANCGVFLHGARRETRAKTLLPDYDVFHERRYFDSAVFLDDSYRAPIPFLGHKLGLLICEDSWEETEVRGKRIYRINPTERLRQAGCDFLINISASPFDHTKKIRRRQAISTDAQRFSLPLAYVNHFGAQDDVLFDGDAFCVGPDGALIAEKTALDEEIFFLNTSSPPERQAVANAPNIALANLQTMLVQGLKDYCAKNGFSKAVLGISGGIDSALAASLAALALGRENVIGLAMPSKFSSTHSIEDAEILAHNVGFPLHHLPIKMPHSTFLLALRPFFAGLPEGIAEENLQSRLRGVNVMAFANKFNALALSTGNKSELAMGYSTLYGDLCGALAPLGDLFKTEVYELARHLNRDLAWIPERTFTKAPSAELKPNQTDQDSLPPYEFLDAVLRYLVVEEMEIGEAHKELLGKFPKAKISELEQIQRRIRLNEYKRRQAPPILKVSSRAFGGGRMYPLTCRF